jgi:hypothetical protein
MLLKDSELLLLINNFLHENSFSQSVFSKLISKNPWQDICFILVVIFIFGVIELRLYHFWVVIINLFLVFGKCINIRIEYYNSLRLLLFTYLFDI